MKIATLILLIMAGCSASGTPPVQLQPVPSVDMAASAASADMTVPPPTCTGSMVACGLFCVDVTTDVANCGSCGAACSQGNSCMGGVCAAPMTGCAEGILCLQGCGMDEKCANDCLSNLTPDGKKLIEAIGDCIDAACPSAGVCASATQACVACIQKAHMTTCSAQVKACAAG